MQVGLRKAMMASLLVAFVGQTTLVYTDDTADRTPPLSELANAGRRLWHEHNCQACHQTYGFGGFLGPDLTNAGRRLTIARLTEVLDVGPTKGTTQMPAFHMNEEQVEAIHTYLIELDKTGIGVPRAFLPPDPSAVYEAVIAHAESATDDIKQGLTMFRAVCSTCHTPFCATPLGPHTAPDLSTVCDRLDDAGILETIMKGRIDRGMPAQPHMEPHAPQLIALMHWLRAERETIADRLGGLGNEASLPWWEFK